MWASLVEELRSQHVTMVCMNVQFDEMSKRLSLKPKTEIVALADSKKASKEEQGMLLKTDEKGEEMKMFNAIVAEVS